MNPQFMHQQPTLMFIQPSSDGGTMTVPISWQPQQHHQQQFAFADFAPMQQHHHHHHVMMQPQYGGSLQSAAAFVLPQQQLQTQMVMLNSPPPPPPPPYTTTNTSNQLQPLAMPQFHPQHALLNHVITPASPFIPQQQPSGQPSGNGTSFEDVRNLYVSSLPNTFSTSQLYDLFAPFGEVVSSRFMPPSTRNSSSNNPSDGPATAASELSRGYGFVCFQRAEDAVRAMHHMIGAVVEGSKIQVRPSRKHAEGTPTLQQNKLQQHLSQGIAVASASITSMSNDTTTESPLPPRDKDGSSSSSVTLPSTTEFSSAVASPISFTHVHFVSAPAAAVGATPAAELVIPHHQPLVFPPMQLQQPQQPFSTAVLASSSSSSSSPMMLSSSAAASAPMGGGGGMFFVPHSVGVAAPPPPLQQVAVHTAVNPE